MKRNSVSRLAMDQRENWKTFESNIKKHSEYLKIPIIKIPNKIIRIRNQLIPVKTEFDFSASLDGISLVFDAKCESSRAGFNLKVGLMNDKKIHQWNNLHKFYYDGAAISGILLWLFDLSKIIFYSVPVIELALKKDEKSLTIETDGALIQDDNDPIDLRKLLKPEVENWIKRTSMIQRTSNKIQP